MKTKVYGLHFFGLDYNDNDVIKKVYPVIFTKPKDAEAVQALWQSIKAAVNEVHPKTKAWMDANKKYWIEEGCRPTPEMWKPFQDAINEYRVGLRKAIIDSLTPEQQEFKANYYDNCGFACEIVEFDLE